MKPSKSNINRINAAFERAAKAVERFLLICRKNNSPVRSITVSTFADGRHSRTHVRYRKTT